LTEKNTKRDKVTSVKRKRGFIHRREDSETLNMELPEDETFEYLNPWGFRKVERKQWREVNNQRTEELHSFYK
jgi:hypothetical protein